MAVYTGRQSLLDEALGKFKEYGFKLVENDDHCVEVYHHGKRIAVYNQQAATIPRIRAGCENYPKSIARQS